MLTNVIKGVKLEVNLKDETVWLNTEQIAKLFDRDYKTIRKHINNALNEELKDEVVVAKFENTTEHGAIDGKTQTHLVDYYNKDCLDVIEKLRFNQESTLFAVERDKGLESIIGNIYQSFAGHDIYKSIEEKGANFLYLIV